MSPQMTSPGRPAGDGKPLFIPLKAEYFEMFASGQKTSELRLYGPRWNEKTCTVGRKVVLSKGYGKSHRIDAKVTEFHKRDARTLGGHLPGGTECNCRRGKLAAEFIERMVGDGKEKAV